MRRPARHTQRWGRAAGQHPPNPAPWGPPSPPRAKEAPWGTLPRAITVGYEAPVAQWPARPSEQVRCSLQPWPHTSPLPRGCPRFLRRQHLPALPCTPLLHGIEVSPHPHLTCYAIPGVRSSHPRGSASLSLGWWHTVPRVVACHPRDNITPSPKRCETGQVKPRNPRGGHQDGLGTHTRTQRGLQGPTNSISGGWGTDPLRGQQPPGTATTAKPPQ